MIENLRRGKEEQAAYCESVDAMYSEIESALETKTKPALATAHEQAVKLHAELETSKKKLLVAYEQTERLRRDLENATQDLREARSQTRATVSTEVSNTMSPWVLLGTASGWSEQPPAKKFMGHKTCSICGMSHTDTRYKDNHPRPDRQYTKKHGPDCPGSSCNCCNPWFCKTPESLYEKTTKRRRRR